MYSYLLTFLARVVQKLQVADKKDLLHNQIPHKKGKKSLVESENLLAKFYLLQQSLLYEGSHHLLKQY